MARSTFRHRPHMCVCVPGSYDVTHFSRFAGCRGAGGMRGGQCAPGARGRQCLLVRDTSLFVNLDAAYFDGVASFNVVATATDPTLSILSGNGTSVMAPAMWGITRAATLYITPALTRPALRYIGACGHTGTVRGPSCTTRSGGVHRCCGKRAHLLRCAYPDPFADELHLETNTQWCTLALVHDRPGRPGGAHRNDACDPGADIMTTSNLPAGLYLLRFGVGGDARSIRPGATLATSTECPFVPEGQPSIDRPYSTCTCPRPCENTPLFLSSRCSLGASAQPCDSLVQAAFEPQQLSANAFVFNNTSWSYSPPNTTYYWTFGDGTQQNDHTGSHTYTEGVYQVRLYAIVGNCGVDTTCQYVQAGCAAGMHRIRNTRLRARTRTASTSSRRAPRHQLALVLR